MPARAAWHRGVSQLYFLQPDRGGSFPLVALTLVGAATVLYYLWS